MTAPSEYEAYLRAALHAAADSLEPRGDSLERIRTRLQHARPRAVVWLMAAWDEIRRRAPAPVQDACYRLAAVLRTEWDRFVTEAVPGKHRSRTQSLLRPLAAMGVVMFIVAAGTYVAIDISAAVSPSSSSLHPQGGQPGPGAAGGSPTSSPSRSGLGTGTGIRHPSPSPSCLSSPSPAPSPAPSCATNASPQPSASASSSPSPSPSPTPTDSSSPTPTPSDSTTGGP